MKETLRYLHLLGVVVWIGGGILFGPWAARARRTGQPHFVTFAAETIAWLLDRAILPAAGLTVASGLALVGIEGLATRPPAWLIAKVALVTIGVVLLLAVQRPTVRALVAALHSTSRKTAAQVPILARRQFRLGIVAGALALVIIGLAVFKP